MQEVPINVVALVVAAIVKFAIGGLWFSPAAFGPMWRTLAGVSEAQIKASMVKAMIVDFIATLVMAFVLVHAIRYAGAQGVAQGAVVGFFNWLGFVAAVGLPASIYEHRPLRLFFVSYGYQLIGIVVMGAILSAWV
ncbi:MAG TPA: DUF1761 domain-containing protein [Stellaceae bacterium]|nr:DUF1761 domain-containing protein [Stellaceae bacterium]